MERMAHLFICPNCGHRTTETDRTAGFRRQAKGCSRCGFGFLFELLDDYYPAPDAAFFVCDAEGRVIGCGRGSFELTGLDDEKVIGRPVYSYQLATIGFWSYALFFHLCTGVRHLFFDAGIGFDLRTVQWSGWLAVAISVILAVISWCWALSLGGM